MTFILGLIISILYWLLFFYEINQSFKYSYNHHINHNSATLTFKEFKDYFSLNRKRWNIRKQDILYEKGEKSIPVNFEYNDFVKVMIFLNDYREKKKNAFDEYKERKLEAFLNCVQEDIDELREQSQKEIQEGKEILLKVAKNLKEEAENEEKIREEEEEWSYANPLVLKAEPLVQQMKEKLINRVEDLKIHGINPELDVFINTDPASQVYVRNKVKFGESIGVKVNTIQGNIDSILKRLKLTGNPFIIQEPSNLSSNFVNDVLNTYHERDADCFGSYNVGNLLLGNIPTMKPCTPYGIIDLLLYHGVMKDINTVTIVGRSKIVGKPLMILLQEYYNRTVFVCHSHTPEDVKNKAFSASDLIVSAVGKPNMYLNNSEYLSGKILVDVGINRNEDGKLCGDFHPIILDSNKAYTPVPGGVGPMTVASLFLNVVNYYSFVYFNKN